MNWRAWAAVAAAIAALDLVALAVSPRDVFNPLHPQARHWVDHRRVHVQLRRVCLPDPWLDCWHEAKGGQG